MSESSGLPASKHGFSSGDSNLGPDQLDTLLAGVESIVREVGAWVRGRAGAADLRIDKKGLNNFVTEVDTGAEQRLVEALSSLLPGSVFLAEEGTVGTGPPDAGDAQERPCWIIDPIDGTTNFIHGLPCFAVSVALRESGPADKPDSGSTPDAMRPAGRETLGVVYEISRDECFSARQGAVSRLNGDPIQVSSCTGLDAALVATGFPYEEFSWMDSYIKAVSEVMRATQGLRRWGSASVDLAYVACGRFDAFFEYNLNPWDVAAGCLIVRQAGGSVGTFSDSGDPVFDRQIIAASNGDVAEALRERIAPHMLGGS